jgi:23S rRNA pseudouridine955/2504/2580 synthase
MPVLWEDDELLAVDKPVGVAVHGGSGIAHGVIERLRAARPEARFLELAHRLDRGTSGVLLIAKRRPALLSLHAQLREGITDKRYRAIVSGRWPLRSKRLDWPLVKTLTSSGERMVYVRSDGQSAATVVTGLAHRDVDATWPMTLIEAKLETGRTHQIRVHCAHAGFPIIGDDRYGDFHLNGLCAQAGWRRMYLHAYQMTFKHPGSGQSIVIVAPQPPAFNTLLHHDSSFSPLPS